MWVVTDEKAFLAAAEEKAEKENPISEIKEEVIERSVIARPLPQSVKIRPWDLGKEGVPKKPGIKLYLFSRYLIYVLILIFFSV